MENNIFNELFSVLEDGDAEAIWLAKLKEYHSDGGDMSAVNPLNGWSLLHYSAENLFDSAVEWLILEGANVNAKDNEGSTPYLVGLDAAIDSAIQYEEATINFSVVKLLIDSGADIDACSDSGISRESMLEDYGSDAEAQYNGAFSI